MPTPTSFKSRLPSVNYVAPPLPTDPKDRALALRWGQVGTNYAESKRLRKKLVVDNEEIPDWIQVLFYRDELGTGISFMLWAFGIIGMINMGRVGLLNLVALTVFERGFYYQFQLYGMGVSGMYSLWCGFMLAGGVFGRASGVSMLAGLIILMVNLWSLWRGGEDIAHYDGHVGNMILGFIWGVIVFYVFKVRASNW